jgi:hypothetical protein
MIGFEAGEGLGERARAIKEGTLFAQGGDGRLELTDRVGRVGEDWWVNGCTSARDAKSLASNLGP